MPYSNRNIFIYGSGNMAWALAKSFTDKGIDIAGISGRTEKNVLEIAQQLTINYCDDITKASKENDVVILAVKDDVLPLLNKSLRLNGRLVLHTAGSVDIHSIADISKTVGVFYPMQRVIKFKEPNFELAPLCIETNTPNLLSVIRGLAEKLSSQVYEISSEQRKNLHLAAVFVNNFTTHMLSIGHDIIKKHALPETILDSLIKSTFENITSKNASDRQTGPARRADIQVIRDHIQQLEKEQPDIAELYRVISMAILKRYNVNTEM